MSSPFLSQILIFAGNFAPKNYAMCNGQTLPINQYQALFSLLGTTYGGNGVNNFQLPNLQSSLPVGWGQGPGLSFYNLGQTGGTTSVNLNQSQVPPHVHSFMCSTSTANTTASAISNTVVPGSPPASGASLYATPPGNPPLVQVAQAAGVCSTVGGSQAHTNLMPSLCVTFAIALSGAFPSRN